MVGGVEGWFGFKLILVYLLVGFVEWYEIVYCGIYLLVKEYQVVMGQLCIGVWVQ